MVHPKVSIIIVNWNGFDDTAECLESLQKITYKNYDVIVVDNASEGNDVQMLEEKFGNYIDVLRNNVNYGFGGGCNSGIRYVLTKCNPKPKYILIMNNDIVVDPLFLDELIKVVESDERIGIVGPKIYRYSYKGRNDVISSAGGRIRAWLPELPHSIGGLKIDSPKYQKMKSVDWISGATMLFRTCIIEEVGLFNTWYFHGLEDVEFCLNVRKRGFNIVYVPKSELWHKVSVSLKKTNLTYADPIAYYYFARRNYPLFVYLYHLFMLPIFIFQWGLTYLFRTKDKKGLSRFLSNIRRYFVI